MSAYNQAFISGAVLHWARQRRGATPSKVAEKINAKPEQIISWESGKELPTFRQAQMMAHHLNIPFGYLFLSEPPVETVPLPDFRTVAGTGRHGSPSPELIDTLYDVMTKQDWYREFMVESAANPIEFVGRFRAQDDATAIAADIANTLPLDEELRRESRTEDDFLREAIRRAELAGVLVMRTGMVCGNTRRSLSVEEFRGFAISDHIAPLVFINSRDSKAAQVFTFAHELAHIWLGETGISDGTIKPLNLVNLAGTERLCNNVAAELLAPQAGFVTDWLKGRSIDDNLHALARHFRVSTLVILRRAHDLGRITNKEYNELYRREERRYEGVVEIETDDEEPASGGNFWNTFFARNGKMFSSAVIEATNEGKLLYREAARLLNVRVPTIQKIAEQIGREITE
jgi:Zn-dependent peptidase ImmA (M78 family)/DNA-binding XRE family transcriptional regulator